MYLYSFYLTFVFLITLELPQKAASKWKCSSCLISYETIGCYKEIQPRQLPNEILNERDKTSKNFRGIIIDWINWNEFMADFSCRCAYETKARGWTVFGLQHWGECWSGPNSEFYKTAAVSDECVGSDYKNCSASDRHCIGKGFVNMVYKIVPECDIKFEPFGCYGDNQVARPLPKLILSDRGERHKRASMDWRNWDVYLPQLVCRCGKKAKEMGYDTFGVQNFGECWSGNKARLTFKRDGLSKNCVDGCFKPCTISDKFCAGKPRANFIYKIDQETQEDKVTDDVTQEEKTDTTFEKFLQDIIN